MKTRSSPVQDPNAGFSLIEMLVVLVIVSLVTGIAGLSLQQIRKAKTPQGLAGELSRQMTALRYRAMNTGRVQTSEIDIERKSFSSGSGNAAIVIPADWTLTVTIGREIAQPKTIPKIIFLPDGTSAGAEIALREPGGEAAYVRVNWLTGLTEFSNNAF